jgi:hypothetical protein
VKKSDSTIITRAEGLCNAYIIEHNLPISVADHATNVPRLRHCKEIQFWTNQNHRYIVNAMSKDTRHCMVADLQRKAYTVCTDGSNDADMKLYPIVITYLNEEL